MRNILIVLFLFLTSLSYAEEGASQKIVYFTIPKGGSQLFRKAIGLIAERPLRKVFPLGETSFLDSYIGYNHIGPGYDAILEDTVGFYTKMIMIRDPRDVIVSMVSWIQVMADTDASKEFAKQPLEKQISELISSPDLSMNGRYPYVFDTHEGIRCALEWMQNPTVLVCRFEDLVGSKGGGSDIKQVAAINSIVKHLHYDFSAEHIQEIADDLFGDTITFRVGQIGAWRQVFTSEHKKLFKEKMGEELIELGYEKDDTW